MQLFFARIAVLSLLAFGSTYALKSLSDEGVGQAGIIGTGRGVDRVTVLVRDLSKAAQDYQSILGFNVGEGGTFGHLLNGISNTIVDFDDGSSLSLTSVEHASNPLAAQRPQFIQEQEGAKHLELRVSSAEDAAKYLQAQGFAFDGPTPATISRTKDNKPGAWAILPASKPMGRRRITLPLILGEYLGPSYNELRIAAGKKANHPNTALSLHGVWFAVRDLAANSAELSDMGLPLIDTTDNQYFGATCETFKAGSGVLQLMQPMDYSGRLGSFMSRYPEVAPIGVTIRVADLEQAQSWIETHAKVSLQPYEDTHGHAILIPPNLTHGLWIEMYQDSDRMNQ